jgi:hypothetical protein
VTSGTEDSPHKLRQIDRFATTVLKAHFQIVGYLDSVLDAAAKKPKYLKAERRCEQKMK